MKGVILAGGTGSRLYPLTRIVNKHLLPVGRYPMIHYGVEKLRSAGIRDILVITAGNALGGLAGYLSDDMYAGIDFHYKVQDRAGGIAHALALAEGFIAPGEKFVVLLGDNLFEEPLEPFLQEFSGQQSGARVLLKRVPDPARYGVPIMLHETIFFIEEKPTAPKTDYCVTGIYMYDSEVFEHIRRVRPSSRGELEITDVNNRYAVEGRLAHSVLKGWWVDAGTHESLYEAGERLLRGERE